MSTRAIAKRMAEKIHHLEADVAAARQVLVHTALAAIVTLEHSNDAVDAVLKLCPVGECMTCARIACPHADPMHFHHDGCPTCAEVAGAKPARVNDTFGR